jgi:hypothetical protein
MQNVWAHSKGAARRALVLGAVALAFIVFPIVWFLVFRFYAEGLGLFVILYLLFAVPATASAVAASRRDEWWRPDGGKRFVCALYGLPILFVLLVAGWTMRL